MRTPSWAAKQDGCTEAAAAGSARRYAHTQLGSKARWLHGGSRGGLGKGAVSSETDGCTEAVTRTLAAQVAAKYVARERKDTDMRIIWSLDKIKI